MLNVSRFSETAGCDKSYVFSLMEILTDDKSNILSVSVLVTGD